jgi:uncharacterized membrane protein
MVVFAYFSYRWLKSRNEYTALVLAGVVGTLTNTVLVLGMAVITGLLDPSLIPGIVPQAIAEIVIAVIIVVAVVTGWKRIEGRQGGSSV